MYAVVSLVKVRVPAALTKRANPTKSQSKIFILSITLFLQLELILIIYEFINRLFANS